MAREGGGLVCPSSLPTVGSKVDVVGIGTATVLQSRPALQSDLYPTSPSLIPGLQRLAAGFDGGYVVCPVQGRLDRHHLRCADAQV